MTHGPYALGAMIGPNVPHDYPRTGLVRYWIARAVFTLFGWDVVGAVPPGRKAVLIAAPHTSLEEAIWTIGGAWIFRVHISIVAKKGLFRWPFGPFLRWLGLFPIDRAGNLGVVEQIASEMRRRDAMLLAIAPEGTRKRRDRWKSGFYWIAMEAGVPIAPGFVDFGRKQVGIGPAFVPTGDVVADMDRIRAFYADIKGKHPDRQTPPRLKEEDALALSSGAPEPRPENADATPGAGASGNGPHVASSPSRADPDR